MTEGCKVLAEIGRRQFLRGSGAAAAGAVATTALSTPGQAQAPAGLARATMPSSRLANIADLEIGTPIDISYPDADSPGVLIKLGAAAENGVGPDGDIVAFSTLCPHKGYPIFFHASDNTFNCPGHYSRFDAEKGGLEIWGQATQNLPQFMLSIDDAGDIHATGVDELIYGRMSNTLFQS